MIVKPNIIPPNAPIIDIQRVKLAHVKKYIDDDYVQVIHLLGTAKNVEAVIFTYPPNIFQQEA